MNYSEPMRNMIYSLLLCSDKSRKYEFIILTSDFTDEIKAKFRRFEADNVAVRFVDMKMFHEKVKDRTKNYISAETNYRLYLFSEDFSEYKRILYLDGDMQAVRDISGLYDTDLEGMAIGACEEAVLIPLAITKKALFFDGNPCNADIYRHKYIGLENVRDYFNAGMLVMDMEKCRSVTDDMHAVEVLTAHRMQFNDQDALNIIFKGKVKQLDIGYNYPASLPGTAEQERFSKALEDVLRDEYTILHYSGPEKPWNKDVPLGEIYKQNYRQMIKEENYEN